MTTTCGPDTVQYTIAKASGISILSFSNNVAFGQWYPAPQPIQVNGFTFFAFVDSATNQTVDVVCKIYNASPVDSLPTGAPLAVDTVTIDSNFFGGNLVLLSKYAHFTPAVTVTGPYVITIENATGIDVSSATNSFVANNGAQEWLGMAFLPPNWLHGYQLFLGANDFDADHLLLPHVEYDITAAYNPNPFNTCSGLTGTFTNASSPIMGSRFYNFNVAAGIPDSSFIWNFGDGSAEEYTINATHTYGALGTYNVTLIDSLEGWTVTCIDSVVGTATFASGTAPVANYTNSATGLVVAFTDNTTNTPTSWAWDFGDGTTSTLQNPSHTYAANGTYTVCLISSNQCGSDTICTPLTIAGCPPLVAAFQDTVIGLTYAALDQSVGTPTSWLWDFGDGSTSTLQNPSHTYAVAGIYTVCLTVDDGCSTDSTCVTVVIGCPIPVASWTNVTAGLVVNFTDGSTNLPTSWFWDFGDGTTSTLQNPSHTYGIAGTFTVCMIASNSCGADTICQSILTGCNTPIAGFTQVPNQLTVQFTDASTNTPTSWLWDFGDGNTSTAQNPNHTYAASGTYTVCLTATSSCGSNTTCNSVTVSCPAPTASFTFTNTQLTINCTSTSTGNPTTYAWDFGDGTTSTLQNPTHVYTQGGTYLVCLTVTSGCGTNTSCQSITLNCALPNSNFSNTNVNLVYSFTDLSTGTPTTWFWTFGDGTTSTQQNPTHTYSNTGTFQVCLVTTNNCGSDTTCRSISVVCPQPSASFSQTANSLVVAFTDLSTGNPTSWSWDFGDGTPASIQSNPTHTYTAAGTYQVCLTATNACGSNTFCMSITVTCPPPTSMFNFNTNGNTASFTNQSTGGATSYFWDFGDGSSSTAANPSHAYTTVGTFNVCMIAFGSCGADTVCRPVIISCVPPAAAFTFNHVNDSVVNFTNNASPNSVAWTWTFGDGSPATTVANPSHTYPAAGNYVVCLIVSNSCGFDTLCQTVTITCTMPTAGYVANVTNSVATFNDVSIGAQSWHWTFGDGLSSNQQNPTHTYTQSGIYPVCLTVTNFCGTNTSCQNLVISCNAPQPSFTYQTGASTIGFTDLTTNNPTTWLWNFGDGSISTQQNPTHGYLFPGQYYVCLTTTNSCGSASFCQWANVTVVGEEEAAILENSLVIYPNPSSGLFSLRAELSKSVNVSLRVTNMLGQEVWKQNAGKQIGLMQTEIDLSNLAKGVYTLEIVAGDNRVFKNLAVE